MSRLEKIGNELSRFLQYIVIDDIYNYLSIALKKPVKALVPNLHTGVDADLLKELLELTNIVLKRIGDSQITYTTSEEIGRTRLYNQGYYYIMELASTAPYFIWRPGNGKKTILDISAAPGGKTFILSNIFLDGVIIANEPIRTRFKRLENNVRRYCLGNVILTNYRGEIFPEDIEYDLILFDAPCTSLNLIYKRPREVIRNLKKLNDFSNIQKKILSRMYNLLKNGGELLYITCTLTEHENINVVKHGIDLGFKIVDIKNRTPFNLTPPQLDSENYPEIKKTYFILPHHNLDKFGGNIGTLYVALMRKRK